MVWTGLWALGLALVATAVGWWLGGPVAALASVGLVLVMVGALGDLAGWE